MHEIDGAVVRIKSQEAIELQTKLGRARRAIVPSVTNVGERRGRCGRARDRRHGLAFARSTAARIRREPDEHDGDATRARKK